MQLSPENLNTNYKNLDARKPEKDSNMVAATAETDFEVRAIEQSNPDLAKEVNLLSRISRTRHSCHRLIRLPLEEWFVARPVFKNNFRGHNTKSQTVCLKK